MNEGDKRVLVEMVMCPECLGQGTSGYTTEYTSAGPCDTPNDCFLCHVEKVVPKAIGQAYVKKQARDLAKGKKRQNHSNWPRKREDESGSNIYQILYLVSSVCLFFTILIGLATGLDLAWAAICAMCILVAVWSYAKYRTLNETWDRENPEPNWDTVINTEQEEESSMKAYEEACLLYAQYQAELNEWLEFKRGPFPYFKQPSHVPWK